MYKRMCSAMHRLSLAMLGLLKMAVSTSHVVVGIFLIVHSSIDHINITLPFSLILCCNRDHLLAGVFSLCFTRLAFLCPSGVKPQLPSFLE